MSDETDRKIREGRKAFLRREAGAVSVQLVAFVDHADDLAIEISREDFAALRRAYEILDAYGKGT